MLPGLDELIERSHVVSLPMAVRFRGVDTREAVIFDGPAGWGEFSPFLEYDVPEAATWLKSGIEAAWEGFPHAYRRSVEVNATIPAVEPDRVPEVVERFPGCRVFKIKVAEKGESLSQDIARVTAVREAVPHAVIRVDANRGYSVEQAVEAARAFGPLDYMEQPCATVEELAEVRMTLQRSGIFCRVAADESIRRADDPYLVAKRQAADVAVLKVAPLGGVRRTMQLAADLNAQHMDVTIASALDTGVGLNAGLAAVAALSGHEDDEGIDVEPNAAGLATQRLFLDDVVERREVINGRLSVEPLQPEPARLEALAASPERTQLWRERLRACHEYLSLH